MYRRGFDFPSVASRRAYTTAHIIPRLATMLLYLKRNEEDVKRFNTLHFTLKENITVGYFSE